MMKEPRRISYVHAKKTYGLRGGKGKGSCPNNGDGAARDQVKKVKKNQNKTKKKASGRPRPKNNKEGAKKRAEQRGSKGT